MSCKLTVLTDNFAGYKLLAEHGLSFLVEHGDTKILFDTGRSDVFLKNAKQIGIDINNEIDTVVLSHGHWDHGNGLTHLRNKTVIAHPAIFTKRYRKSDHSYLGLSYNEKELKQNFKLILSSASYKINRQIYFLGEIPRLNDFESQDTTFITDTGLTDMVPDDSAIAINNNNKLVLITGCSHSGICNIVTHAKKITGLDKVQAIIGGLHLKKADHLTRRTMEFLIENQVQKVYPSHCTALPAMNLLHSEFKCVQVKTGMTIEFP
ncbi:MAG: MBL fold metallo-hydrolase [Bacteroidales bacterium]|nr:MBL fold metallo-hydrolase [Bacteroidales bacterium]